VKVEPSISNNLLARDPLAGGYGTRSVSMGLLAPARHAEASAFGKDTSFIRENDVPLVAALARAELAAVTPADRRRVSRRFVPSVGGCFGSLWADIPP
jgi:hypothetical protein